MAMTKREAITAIRVSRIDNQYKRKAEQLILRGYDSQEVLVLVKNLHRADRELREYLELNEPDESLQMAQVKTD